MNLPDARANTQDPRAEAVQPRPTLTLGQIAAHGPPPIDHCAAPDWVEREKCDHFFALLREFYETLPGLPAIEATFVPTDSIPQPQHDLLVHLRDMTSTLTRHYGEPLTLKVLHRHQGPQWYRRHIILETVHSLQPVEYGAMRILLSQLSEAARQEVLDARSPLGAVLARHGLAYRHCPGGFFRIRSNRLIEQSLGLPAPMAVRPLQLYERHRRAAGRRSHRSPSPEKNDE